MTATLAGGEACDISSERTGVGWPVAPARDAGPPRCQRYFSGPAGLTIGSGHGQTTLRYDAGCRPTGIGYADHTSESFAASYNEWDQLTALGSLEGYGYIAGSPAYDVGTLQTKGSESYAYPAPGQARPHAPTSVSTIGAYTYDANGNRASDASATYSYDIENHLTQLAQGGTAVLQNTFDGNGVRLVRVASGVTTHFVGDWYEVNLTSGIATAYYPFNGRAVAMKQGNTLSYLHHDQLGSLVSATGMSSPELGWLTNTGPLGAPAFDPSRAPYLESISDVQRNTVTVTFFEPGQ